MTTSILSLYTQHDSDFIFQTTRIPSAVVLFNAPASFEKERTLSQMLEQHGSSTISVIPSIHEWGGRRDGFYVDRSDKEPPSTTFIIRMESSHSTFPWAPLFFVCVPESQRTIPSHVRGLHGKYRPSPLNDIVQMMLYWRVHKWIVGR